jgi:DNA (cytosine-5)-methyltransferase 1
MIPVIDLFAGPGGLGEGFSRLEIGRERLHPFRIALSIEKDKNAHRTLWLRSFYRQFTVRGRSVPDAYYSFLKGSQSLAELFRRFPVEARRAHREAWRAELGQVSSNFVDKRIREALRNNKTSFAGSKPFWVLIGGPPCQAYSLVGRARRINADPIGYAQDHRHLLYREYLRILAAHRPPVFVMENVKGILSSRMNGSNIFDQIRKDLERPLTVFPELFAGKELEYQLFPVVDYTDQESFAGNQTEAADFVVRCEEHGIPQCRHRVILLGIDKTLVNAGWMPGRLRNLAIRVTVQQAIGGLPRTRSLLSREKDTADAWHAAVEETLDQIGKDVPSELRNVMLALTGNLNRRQIDKEYFACKLRPHWNVDWFHDGRLDGVCNHSVRSHRRDDLWRYFYAGCYAKVQGLSPLLYDFPPSLWPQHKNVSRERVEKETLDFGDRFKVQLAGQPSATITSHIAKDGHYYIHPDPRQCRSLTVREAARLQTFSDNYVFIGGRTSQYQQVGNAVPPLLARKIGKLIMDMLAAKSSQHSECVAWTG